jgi:hypothetical protein
MLQSLRALLQQPLKASLGSAAASSSGIGGQHNSMLQLVLWLVRLGCFSLCWATSQSCL